ncbi:unnamed protein product [Darwinula stevensoni]|uniref:Ribosomal protein eL8/eL30/eS12/Gadd45 domain-containing protein n=1 Tax=Darwinula stevensoni TaxID=69355 RepID=A0A7R8XEP9_9CRUS|nr:unnamed protein product [Darwinula stevensoni]CAG0895973.1 unnamed protein product [Darwinula stevensoni]
MSCQMSLDDPKFVPSHGQTPVSTRRGIGRGSSAMELSGTRGQERGRRGRGGHSQHPLPFNWTAHPEGPSHILTGRDRTSLVAHRPDIDDPNAFPSLGGDSAPANMPSFQHSFATALKAPKPEPSQDVPLEHQSPTKQVAGGSTTINQLTWQQQGLGKVKRKKQLKEERMTAKISNLRYKAILLALSQSTGLHCHGDEVVFLQDMIELQASQDIPQQKERAKRRKQKKKEEKILAKRTKERGAKFLQVLSQEKYEKLQGGKHGTPQEQQQFLGFFELDSFPQLGQSFDVKLEEEIKSLHIAEVHPPDVVNEPALDIVPVPVAGATSATAAEKQKHPKRKDPINLDLFSLVQSTASKLKTKQKKERDGKVSTKERGNAIRVANILDSAPPKVRRGKERLKPKRKKPSVLKRIILNERQRKKLLRELDALGKAGNHATELTVHEPPKAITECTGDNPPMVTTEAIGDEPLEDATESTGGKHCETESVSEIKSSCDVTPVMEPTEEEKSSLCAKTYLHSRKFRDYCTHFLSEELNSLAVKMIQDLIRFQDRLHARDPVKARARRRMVYGFREILKYLDLRKVKCVFVAPDIEPVKAKGGLNDVVWSIRQKAEEQGAACIFILNRYRLGKVCLKKVPVSAVAVLDHQGTEETFQKLLSMVDVETSRYSKRLKELSGDLDREIIKSNLPQNESEEEALRSNINNSLLLKLAKEIQSLQIPEESS